MLRWICKPSLSARMRWDRTNAHSIIARRRFRRRSTREQDDWLRGVLKKAGINRKTAK